MQDQSETRSTATRRATPRDAVGPTLQVKNIHTLLTMDEVDEQVIQAFINRYEGVDHHVQG